MATIRLRDGRQAEFESLFGVGQERIIVGAKFPSGSWLGALGCQPELMIGGLVMFSFGKREKA